jgi:predicted RNase H-like HicB family nuclease
MERRKPLEFYLALQYPFRVDADPDGGYVIEFPDLPGCLTQADEPDEIGPMAEEARSLWLETEFEAGKKIPLPSYPPEYSGKFNLRLPKSLHAQLTQSAEREGVSLNQYVVSLLSASQATTESRRSLDLYTQIWMEASPSRFLDRLGDPLSTTRESKSG